MKCLLEKIIKYPALIIIIMMFLVINTAEKEGRSLQEGISDKIIRFHVRANSDTEEDQQLKLEVRNGVMEYLEPLLSESESTDETRRILSENIDEIIEISEKIIIENGYAYNVDVYFNEEYFPLRKYGNAVFPSGEYEAFRIDIGDACGKNWWCVLYPAMCFVETTHAVYDEEGELKSVLTDEEFEYVTDYTVQFKYLTFLNKYL